MPFISLPQACACLFTAALLAATGCSGRGFAEVTGTVRVDGKPLQGAFVTFTPDESGVQRGVGSTNAEGRYRVIRPGGKFGAAIGVNTVSVMGGDQGRSLPESYSSASTLKFEVKRGSNVFDIDIPTHKVGMLPQVGSVTLIGLRLPAIDAEHRTLACDLKK